MSKNKGTHGRGKEVAQEPDEFVQRVSSVSDILQPHYKKIAFAVCLVIAGLGAWKFNEHRHQGAAQSATAAYVSALKVVEADVVGEEAVEPEKESPVPVITYPSAEAHQAASMEALSGVASKHADMKLSGLADIRQGKILMVAGKYKEALAAFESFAKSDAPEVLRMSAMEGAGYALEGLAMSNEDAAARQSGLESALRAFSELQPVEGGPMRDYSLYHQGRILVAMGKQDEGVAKYKQLLNELPDSSLTTVVESRLDTLGVDGE